MKKHLITACLYTAITSVLLGLLYPLAITAIAHLLFAEKAAGQLITKDGIVIGSRLIGQPFSGPRYFHSRPSAAGNGYDATASSGSNLGPTSKTLLDRVHSSTAQEFVSGAVPIDLVTASGSGLDPDITPAAAFYQVSTIAAARKLSPGSVEALINSNIETRQFGLLGEFRVNVLQLNLALDELSAHGQ